VSLIEDQSIEDQLAQIEAAHKIRVAPEPRLFVPFVQAADEYERWSSHPEERIYTGIAPLDAAMRGIAPGQIGMLIGYNHAGKTVVATHMLIHNNDRRVLLFSPDETRMALAVKLTCAVAGVNAETLEERIREGDEQAASLVRRCITNQFPTLAVCEDMLDLNEMSRYMREVTDAWGAKPELVIYDYLQLLPGFDAVPQQMSALKGWGKREDVPVVVLHQTSRSSGADGKKISIDSGAFGGEPLATFVIGVRRKKSEFLAKIEAIREQMESPNISSEKHERLVRVQLDLQDELTRHENTISVSLVKNKTPPSRLVDDLDFDLDADTGRMRARP
jgi:hypothetical protein